MIHFATYRVRTGEITGVGYTPRLDLVAAVEPGTALVEVGPDVRQASHYIEPAAGNAIPRMKMAVNVVGLTLSNLPPGTVIEIEKTRYEAVDHTVRLAFNIAGPHTVRLTAPKYEDSTIVLNDD